MLLRIFVSLAVLMPVCIYAQTPDVDNAYRYNLLLSKYNKKLDTVNRILLQSDTAMARTVLLANGKVYEHLIDLDTMVAKPLLAENVASLDLFLALLKSDTASAKTKQLGGSFFQENAAWYERQLQNAGLESCPQCFLIRKVRITVLRRINDQQLDTIKCVSVDCKKILVNNISAKEIKAMSYPCPEYERTLSTGPKYQFVVSYDGKKEILENSVDIGSALTDIQKISLVVSKQ